MKYEQRQGSLCPLRGLILGPLHVFSNVYLSWGMREESIISSMVKNVLVRPFISFDIQ